MKGRMREPAKEWGHERKEDEFGGRMEQDEQTMDMGEREGKGTGGENGCMCTQRQRTTMKKALCG